MCTIHVMSKTWADYPPARVPVLRNHWWKWSSATCRDLLARCLLPTPIAQPLLAPRSKLRLPPALQASPAPGSTGRDEGCCPG